MKQLVPLLLFFLAACSSGKNETTQDSTQIATTVKTAVSKQPQPAPEHTDTLQFIHFDGNTDYWYAYFLNEKKDTVRLVTDQDMTDNLLGKLLQVMWKEDILSEAGDGERPYKDERLISFKPIQGAPFAQPLTEQAALKAIQDLEEVKSNADRVAVSEKPTADKRYYQVETSTEADGHLSRFYTFRVYFYPQYEIKIYDPADDKETSLDEWRKAK